MLPATSVATRALVDLFAFDSHAKSPEAVKSKMSTVACGDHTYAQCPMYFEGCFDYSPMFCDRAVPMPPPSAPAWQPSKQAPATLWQDVPAANLSSRLPMEVQQCIRHTCDALEPTQASLCYCQGTADDPSACDPPQGLAKPLAMLAHAACMATSGSAPLFPQS